MGAQSGRGPRPNPSPRPGRFARGAAHLVRALLVEARAHGTPLLAAALAFFALFSLTPLVLLATAAAGALLPADRLAEELAAGASLYAPGAKDIVRANLDRLVGARHTLGLVGTAGLLWGASNVFSVLTTTLNRVWDAERRRAAWWRRGLGLLLVAVSVLALAAALALGPAARAASALAREGLGPTGAGAAHAAEETGRFAFPAAVFAAAAGAYRYLPAVRPRPAWRAVLPAAALAALAVAGARRAFAWYASGLGMHEIAFGGLTSFLALALWVYVVASVFLYGAELAAVLDRRARPRR